MAMQNRDRLLKRLKAIKGKPRAAMRVALEQGAKQVVASAKNLAQVKSGDLVNSIDYTFGDYKPANANVRGVSAGARGGDPDLSVTIHVGDEKAFYAGWVEFGTNPHFVSKGGSTKIGAIKARLKRATPHPGAQAHPFFYPAWRANKKSIKARITRAMNKAIKDGANA